MAHVLQFPEPDYFAGAVAGNIRAEAARRGINQTGLAAILGVDQANVSRRWRGQRPFSLADLAKIAEAFGVSPAVLVTIPPETANRELAGLLSPAVVDLASYRALRRQPTEAVSA